MSELVEGATWKSNLAQDLVRPSMWFQATSLRQQPNGNTRGIDQAGPAKARVLPRWSSAISSGRSE